MTDYVKSINKTEGEFGVKFTGTAGTGGTTAGYPVKYSSNRTIVLASASTDIIIGIAQNTVSEGGAVNVLGSGCLVKVPFTLTAGSVVGFDGTNLEDYTSKTVVGYTWVNATSASIIRVKPQYAMA